MDQDTNTPEVTAAPVTPETPASTVAAPVTTPASTAHQVSKGVIVGTLVFATILIVATYVALSDVRTPIQRGLPPQLPATSTVDTDPAAAALSVQGTSDEVVDIEADLNATDFNSLEEIDQI